MSDPVPLEIHNVAKQLSGLSVKLEQLNTSLRAAGASTERLSTVLARLTAAGVAVGLLSVIVAVVALAHNWK
jgi:hypothetical protein